MSAVLGSGRSNRLAPLSEPQEWAILGSQRRSSRVPFETISLIAAERPTRAGTNRVIPAVEEERVRTPSHALLTWRGAPWAGGSLLLALTAVALFFYTGSAPTAPSTAPQAGADDITFGPKSAHVVLVEYSDFQCEVCAAYSKTLTPLRAQLADSVQFVFRFFPLAYHQNGMAAAQASYAAHLQGKFWEMHDLLYENQQEWSDAADPYPYFDTYASSLGLDTNKFRDDYEASTTQQFITKQKMDGDAAGVSHTPWFVLNDSVITPRNPQELAAIIQDSLLNPSSFTTSTSTE